MKRLRLLGVTIIPSFVVDDDTHLHPLKVEPLILTSIQWPDAINIFNSAVLELKIKIETSE